VLGTLVLALHDDPGGQVGDPHGGVRLVDVLAPLARGAVGVDPQVLLVDVDDDLVAHLGVDEDRRERGVAPRGGVERRDPDEPVDAGFGLGVAEGVFPLHLHRDALEPCLFAGLEIEDLGLEAALFRPSEIHPQEDLRPVLRLRAARAGMNRQDGVQPVLVPSEHAADFRCPHDLGEALQPALDLFEGLFVPGLGRQFEQHVEILQLPVDLRPRLDGGFDAGLFAQDVLCLLRVVPQVRLGALLLEIPEATGQPLDVKDNLGGFPPVFSNPTSFPGFLRPSHGSSRSVA